jgi:hypothetical protein
MSLEQDLIGLYTSNRTLDEENSKLRDELAATRRESAAALAAAQEGAKKANEPPPSAPAAPPVPLPRNTGDWFRLPLSERERIEDERPGFFNRLLELRPGVRIADPLNGHLYAPGEQRPAGAPPPDLRLAEETRARHAATVRKAFADEPASYSVTNGRTRTASPSPFIPTPALGGRKSAVSTAKR